MCLGLTAYKNSETKGKLKRESVLAGKFMGKFLMLRQLSTVLALTLLASQTVLLPLTYANAPPATTKLSEASNTSNLYSQYSKKLPAQTFQFLVDAIDPSAVSNPKGNGVPGFRGENQLIVYTRNFGKNTQTNQAGWEVTVADGKIIRISQGNSIIPENGFVLSANGSAAQWLMKFAKLGAQVSLMSGDDALMKSKISIQHTPAVILYEADQAIQQAKSGKPANETAYRKYLEQAVSCRAELLNRQKQPLSEETIALGERCKQDANRAFYNTMVSHPEEFRGVWIRPGGNDAAQIHEEIVRLKKAHIGHIFLETYFQGKTAYPSQVMKDYGLPEQHPQFRGGDPVEVWTEAAHREGLKIHLWAQIFFAGNQRENIEQFGPILQRYPEWRNVQRPNWNISTPLISDIEPGHYFLDPANAKVREFLQKLLLEMVSHYDVDGLNLDYIRYPASASVSKGHYLTTTWGYTETARLQFQTLIAQERQTTAAAALNSLRAAGKPTPLALQQQAAKPLLSAKDDPVNLTLSSPLWPRWVSWRKAQVSQFVSQISSSAHALKPNLFISAVVFPSSDSTYVQKLQDYPRWAAEGSIQALTPIGLSTVPEVMTRQCLHLQQQVQNKIPVYVGIFGLYYRIDPTDLVRQINAVHQAGMPGLVLFDGSRMTPAYEESLLEGPFRE